MERSGERGSRRHWWADKTPSLMMMLLMTIIDDHDIDADDGEKC